MLISSIPANGSLSAAGRGIAEGTSGFGEAEANDTGVGAAAAAGCCCVAVAAEVVAEEDGFGEPLMELSLPREEMRRLGSRKPPVTMKAG